MCGVGRWGCSAGGKRRMAAAAGEARSIGGCAHQRARRLRDHRQVLQRRGRATAERGLIESGLAAASRPAGANYSEVRAVRAAQDCRIGRKGPGLSGGPAQLWTPWRRGREPRCRLSALAANQGSPCSCCRRPDKQWRCGGPRPDECALLAPVSLPCTAREMVSNDPPTLLLPAGPARPHACRSPTPPPNWPACRAHSLHRTSRGARVSPAPPGRLRMQLGRAQLRRYRLPPPPARPRRCPASRCLPQPPAGWPPS